ncbi:MAG TPA: AgmX/PglI C-terminal domain-containing protein [Pseudobdellovibrionaceae bacterium]|jgi:TonB family protein
MSTARKFTQLLILENTLGQKVRTFAVDSRSLNIVYLKDQRRIDAVANLKTLEDRDLEYILLKTFEVKDLDSKALKLQGLGQLRMMDVNAVDSPDHQLAPEKDKKELKVILEKTFISHILLVLILMMGAWISTKFFSQKKEEPALVTIVMTKPEPKIEKATPAPHVKVSEKKIKPTPKVYRPVVQKKLLTKPYKVKTAKATDVQRVGALAALGGLAKGHRGAEGLDMNSLKNIRSAGEGQGGGGVGATGRGGVKGMMPGSGLIAGSAGEGGRAESAGGYGTRGVGGGRAGYGKHAIVGGMTPVSLPLDNEATVEGGLDRDQIIAVINKNKGQIIYCYEKGLQAQPSIGGRVAVDFTIGPSGRITLAKVAQTSLGSKFVENCMLDKMRTWQFPKPVGKVNVDVLYPFELTRVSSR